MGINRKELEKIYRSYNLNENDVFTDKRGFTIITRSGVEKIQYNKNIQVEYNVITCELDNVVLKGISYIQNKDGDWLKQMESFGSASVNNCRQHFLAEIAEKRCLARVIIKTIGLTNTYGEDELKNQPNDNKR
tara:strand:+ start:423 stop:821 length:399 start_codon:yes stop_codon:yes gene_type:complete